MTEESHHRHEELPSLNKGSLGQGLCCPQCGSGRLYRDGMRHIASSRSVQRWLCRDCAYRFSEKRPLQKKSDWHINSAEHSFSNSQVCELLQESKNLTETARQETAQREGTTQTADIKGKIVEFLWHLKKEAYSQRTIETYG